MQARRDLILETDTDKLIEKARAIPSMVGSDLAKVVSTKQRYVWETGERSHEPTEVVGVKDEPARFHVVATTTASSTTSCASWRAKAARSPLFG